MTKEEALQKLKKLPYLYISYGLLHTEFYPFKKENFKILKECQEEMPELRIYESEMKFRLMVKI